MGGKERRGGRTYTWAFKELGITRIIGPTACGSLQAHVKPGSMVVADQIVDRTSGRKDTFYDGPITTHVSFADPYCAQMRPVAVKALRDLNIDTQTASADLLAHISDFVQG